MNHALAADAVLIVHLLFVAFALLGALTVLWRRWMAWVHLPCAIWGAWIELSGRICPLTPLENHFRRLAGQAGYEGGFVAHYLLPVLYPEGLTREHQILLGAVFLVINIGLYVLVWLVSRRESGSTGSDPESAGHQEE